MSDWSDFRVPDSKIFSRGVGVRMLSDLHFWLGWALGSGFVAIVWLVVDLVERKRKVRRFRRY